MAGGRPLKWENVEEIEPLIEEYFKTCDTDKRPYTVTGLAYALDCSRSTLIDYEGKGKFSNTIKKAKERCERYAEEKLYSGGQVAGVIFSMKNNWNWKDKIDIDADVKTHNKETDEELDNRIKSLLGGLDADSN